MGFGSETITTVGSSAYNLAGEPENRGNFLKNNLISSIMSGQANKDGLGNSIFTAHRYGPRTDLISFARWADYSGYSEVVGFPKGFIYRGSRVDADSFAMLKVPEPGKESEFLYGLANSINYQYFAYWYIGEYLPSRINEAFTIRPETVTTGSFFNRETVLTGNLILKFTGTGEEITFTPPVSIKSPFAIYAYHFYHTRVIEPVKTFDSGWINVIDEAAFPSVDGFTLDGTSSSVVNGFVLSTTVTTNISYSDSTPPTETTSTSSVTREEEDYQKVYKKTEIFPSASGSPGSYERNWTIYHKCVWEKITLPAVVQTTEEEISPGVFKTTTVTTVENALAVSYDYKNTWAQVLTENWDNERVLIYRKGDNAAVDNFIFGDFERDTGLYLPIIPLRLHNRAVNKTNYPAQYALNRKAARRAFKKASTIDKLLKNLNSNKQVSEIDHAWVVFGSSLGSKEQDALNYNYQFMKDWVEGTPYDPKAIKNPYEYSAALIAYWEALEEYEKYSTGSVEVNIKRRPPRPIPPVTASYKFQTYQVSKSWFTSERVLDTKWAYNIMVSARGGDLRTGTSYHSRSSKKAGTCWVYKEGSVAIKTRVLVSAGEGSYWEYKIDSYPVIVFGKQLTVSTWEEYVFFDMSHTNYVYEGLSVVTTADKALKQGENSSFLLPMSDQVLKNMQMIEGTQLAMASSYLVINYYDKQKVPWYASGFFKVVLIVIVIVVFVYTGYVDGSTMGVLGTNAAVGATLGFAAGSTAAILAGAVVNALAAAIISAIITKLSMALLGDKIGAIVGAVASMVVVWGMTNNWNFSAGDLMHSFTKADNLIKMSMSGADMAAQYMQASAQQIIADTQSLLEDYKDKATELAAMTQQYLGSSGIDPTVIAEATRNLVESPEDFLSRTLMTGDDIVDITLSLVERFPEPQLKLPYT